MVHALELFTLIVVLNKKFKKVLYLNDKYCQPSSSKSQVFETVKFRHIVHGSEMREHHLLDNLSLFHEPPLITLHMHPIVTLDHGGC